MAQYDKLINLGLLSQFLTKAKTIFAPKITASGILKGDGAGGVTAAVADTDYATPGLGLTGAKVGDLVRVNAVDSNGKPTSWKRVPLNEIKCNRNLLDNWYFVGGGSQLVDGVFPINQRGQTTYSGAGYGIDRWRNHQSDSCAMTLNANGVTVQNASSTSRLSFMQYLDNEQYLYGKIITGTILLTDGAMHTGSITIPNSKPDTTRYGSFVSFNEHTMRIAMNASGPFAFEIMVKAKSTVSIAAMKLELGSEQTLAHNEGTDENPVWVLNEIPDYGEELRKCQRYFLALGSSIRFPNVRFTSNEIDFLIPLPVTMRSIASISRFTVIQGSTQISGFSYAVQRSSSNAINIRATKNAHGLSVANGIYLDTNAAYISAEP